MPEQVWIYAPIFASCNPFLMNLYTLACSSFFPLFSDSIPQKYHALGSSLLGCEFCHSLRYDMEFPTILTFLYPVFPVTDSIAPYSSKAISLFLGVKSSPILHPESYRVYVRALSLEFFRDPTSFCTSSSVIMLSGFTFLFG